MAIVNNERKVGTRFAIVLEVQKSPNKSGDLCKGCFFKSPTGCESLGEFEAGFCASCVRTINKDEVIFKHVEVMEIE